MPLRNAARACALFGTLALVAGAAAPAAERRYEDAYAAIPSAAGARESSRVIDESYHYPGTPGDYRLAAYMRDRMREFGLDARIESFEATVYTPQTLELRLLASPAVTFDLRDPAIAADPSGSRGDIGLPFNAGSGDGDVTAPMVYAGAGLDADYARLRGAGVAVRGKIVLVRYGAEYRGNLALRAQRKGAAGVVFFTDTRANKGPAYPNGPYPSDLIVQRGEVMGDDNLPLRIPTLPIDGRNAKVLLANLRGSQTASPVRLRVRMNARRTTLWNAIGEIAGTNPNQSVVLGAHRDAWVYGVSDDGSGVATLLEVARGLGRIHREGWNPKRTIVVAGWDAEEIGELGSAAYVAAHRARLQNGCIAYINTDESASGPNFGASAAGAIANALVEPIESRLGIAHPDIDPPAGGSDFESFIYTMGTPIADLGYTGALGTYHSPYDDYRFASLYADPGFVHHTTIARTIGIAAMRLAQTDRPFEFQPYAAALDAGARAMAKDAARGGLSFDAAALGGAVGRVEDDARRADESQRTQNVPLALRAVQRLDLIAYSANGYASVAFPDLANAIATGKQPRLDAALKKTIAALNDVATLLSALRT